MLEMTELSVYSQGQSIFTGLLIDCVGCLSVTTKVPGLGNSRKMLYLCLFLGHVSTSKAISSALGYLINCISEF